MQCSAPRPQIKSTEWMPMILLSGKQAAMMIEGVAVVGVVEGGDEDETRWRCRSWRSWRGGAGLRRRRGRAWAVRAILKGSPSGLRAGAEAVEVFGEGKVILVVGVGFDAGEDGVVGDEAGDVVDVAVGVVAGGAAVEPDDLIDAEVVVEGSARAGGGCPLCCRGRGCAAGRRRGGTLRW